MWKLAVIGVVCCSATVVSGCSSGGEAAPAATVTVTASPEPVSQPDACADWARAVNVDGGLNAELIAADKVSTAAQAFSPGSKEYRAFIIQAAAMYQLAVQDHQKGGGLHGLNEWIRARSEVRAAAALVDAVCP